jgi:cell wall-associated NlpC family hydrolase
MSSPDPRAAIVAEARSWIGTPYRHQASLKGVGTDCLGLLRGVWRGVIGAEPEAVPPQSGAEVAEVALDRWWMARLVAVFEFP